mgnify:CR=1 FL=1
MKLTEVIKEQPNLIVQVRLEDLLDAGKVLIDNTKCELEQQIADSKTERYLSKEKVMETLDVSSVTLWRWQNRGYLTPIYVGGKQKYRMSDIEKIMEGKK